VNQLTSDLKEKDVDISRLNDKINELEQNQLAQNLEIHGIHTVEGEDVAGIVCKIGEAMGVATTGVIEAYRVVTKRPNVVPPIVVKFSSSSARATWMDKKKTRNLTVGKIFKVQSNVNVYVNEQLSSLHKNLLWKAKILAKEREYKYVWTKYGKIFARKNDSMGIVRIRNEDDLLKL
jgi:hypothetical protein